MAIQFQCPAGHWLSVGEQFAGKRFRCPKCQAIVRVPEVAAGAGPQPGPVEVADAAGAGQAGSAERQASQTSANIVVEQWQLADTTAVEMPTAAAPAPPLDSPDEASTDRRSLAEGSAVAEEAVQPAPGPRKSPPPLPKRPVAEQPAPPLEDLSFLSATHVTPAPVEPRPAIAADDFAGALSDLLASPGLQDQPLLARAKSTAAVHPSHIPATSNASEDQAADADGKPLDAYRAQNVYFLGMALGLLSVFHAMPALRHYELGAAPDWARAVAILSLIEFAYVVWMVTVPDWLTVRVAMLLFAVVSALYGMILAMVIVTPRGHPLWLDLDDVREPALWWCGGVMLVTCLMTYLCGRLSFRWRKAVNRAQGEEEGLGKNEALETRG
jgi:hypothetical protein